MEKQTAGKFDRAANSAVLSTHRLIQLNELNDRASTKRVMNYINAGKAVSIGNQGAARYFTAQAGRWEAIRISSLRALLMAKASA